MASQRPATPNPWLVLPVVLVLMVVWTSTDFPLDYWLHVNSGRWMSEQGQLVQADVFSHTIAGRPINNQPWLAQLAMFGLHQWGGYELNQFVAGICYAAALGIVLWLGAKRAGRGEAVIVWGLLSFWLMSFNLGVRPQAFAFPLFALQLAWLTRLSRPMVLAVACFATEVLWTNIHGSFPLGVVLPALTAAAAWIESHERWSSKEFRGFTLAAIAAAAGAFVNPFPQRTLSYVWGVSSTSAQRGLEEWLPPTLTMPSGAALALTSVAIIGVLLTTTRRLRVSEAVLLIPFALLAVGSQRVVAWWGLIVPWAMAPSTLSVTLPKWLQRQNSDGQGRVAAPAPAWVDRLVVAAVCCWLVMITPWTRIHNPLLPADRRAQRPLSEPVELARAVLDWIARDLPCDVDGIIRQRAGTSPTLHVSVAAPPAVPSIQSAEPTAPIKGCTPLSWGSYFSWHTRGRLTTFVDSRVDSFPDDVWDDYRLIQSGSDRALEVLDRYDVQLVVCESSNRALRRQLAASGAWREVYADALGGIWLLDKG